MVHATVQMTINNKGSSTGAAVMGGLPFTSASGSDGYSAAAHADVGGVTFTSYFSWRITPNSTSGILIHNGGNALTETAFANNFQAILSVNYIT